MLKIDGANVSFNICVAVFADDKLSISENGVMYGISVSHFSTFFSDRLSICSTVDIVSDGEGCDVANSVYTDGLYNGCVIWRFV